MITQHPIEGWRRNWAYIGPYTNDASRIEVLNNSSLIAIDIETVSLEDKTIMGIGFSPNPSESFYFPIDSPYLPWRLIASNTVTKIFHNGHFDIKILEEYLREPITNILDSIIAASLLGLPPALDQLARQLFGVELTTITDLLGKRGKNQKTMVEIPEEQVIRKCCNDTKYTYKIMEILWPYIPQQAFTLEMEYMPLIKEIESRGILVDQTRLEQHRERVARDVEYYRSIARGMGFNPGSSMQVAAMLQSRGWEIYYNRDTGKPMLNKEMLQTYYAEDPISQLTLLYREANILLTTFIDAIINKHLKPDGKIYGTINQIATKSGRTSRSSPNLQNQPPELRDIYIASEGCEIEEWDLSQIELRVLAYLVWKYIGDDRMLRVYTDVKDKPSDIHASTAEFMFGSATPENRRIAKELNFSIIYGGDEHTLYQRRKIPLAQGWEFIQKYFATYPGVKQLINMTRNEILQKGYTETEYGRRRYFPPEQLGYERGIEKAVREGFNHRIQGTAGEVQKELQLRVKDSPQINMVHDSIEFDKPVGEQLDRDASFRLREYRTPMEVKCGESWGGAKLIGTFG